MLIQAHRPRRPNLSGEDGLAMVETVPLIVIFVVMTSFAMGFYGVVQTAILHSIAARTYTFETFRQRTNLYYFREDGSGLNPSLAYNFSKKGWRWHAVQNAKDDRSFFVPSQRNIALGSTAPSTSISKETHNVSIYSMQPRNQRFSVNPVWIMVGYGICLNAGCSGT